LIQVIQKSWIDTKTDFITWYILKKVVTCQLWQKIRVITKLPNTEQSSKGKGKTNKSTDRQNQSTTGKLGKPQYHLPRSNDKSPY